MGYWFKVIGGVAGFAVGGPFGAVVGAALGHAADQGGIRIPGLNNAASLGPARVAAMFGRKEELWSLGVVALSAKLAKCDGPVSRTEIDAFKRHFRIPPQSERDIARLFDAARENPQDFESYAIELGTAFSDNHGMLEEVLCALFAIARSDGEVNIREADFLRHVHRAFGLDQTAWDRARGVRPRQAPAQEAAEDPYAVLGVARSAGDAELHAAWKKLARENHPDTLAARGVPPEFVARATDKIARINAAWDVIKRARGL